MLSTCWYRFDCIEEPINLNCNKRPSQTMPMSEQLKRMKIGDIEACSVSYHNHFLSMSILYHSS